MNCFCDACYTPSERCVNNRMDNKLAIFIPNLLNWDGDKQIIGGLERYMIALAELMTEMGYDLSKMAQGCILQESRP